MGGRTGLPLWEIAVGYYSWLTPIDGDLTGDGVPDLALMTSDEDDRVTATFLSGAGGDPLWAETVARNPWIRQMHALAHPTTPGVLFAVLDREDWRMSVLASSAAGITWELNYG